MSKVLMEVIHKIKRQITVKTTVKLEISKLYIYTKESQCIVGFFHAKLTY